MNVPGYCMTVVVVGVGVGYADIIISTDVFTLYPLA